MFILKVVLNLVYLSCSQNLLSSLWTSGLLYRRYLPSLILQELHCLFKCCDYQFEWEKLHLRPHRFIKCTANWNRPCIVDDAVYFAINLMNEWNLKSIPHPFWYLEANFISCKKTINFPWHAIIHTNFALSVLHPKIIVLLFFLN